MNTNDIRECIVMGEALALSVFLSFAPAMTANQRMYPDEYGKRMRARKLSKIELMASWPHILTLLLTGRSCNIMATESF